MPELIPRAKQLHVTNVPIDDLPANMHSLQASYLRAIVALESLILGTVRELDPPGLPPTRASVFAGYDWHGLVVTEVDIGHDNGGVSFQSCDRASFALLHACERFLCRHVDLRTPMPGMATATDGDLTRAAADVAATVIDLFRPGP